MTYNQITLSQYLTFWDILRHY